MTIPEVVQTAIKAILAGYYTPAEGKALIVPERFKRDVWPDRLEFGFDRLILGWDVTKDDSTLRIDVTLMSGYLTVEVCGIRLWQQEIDVMAAFWRYAKSLFVKEKPQQIYGTEYMSTINLAAPGYTSVVKQDGIMVLTPKGKEPKISKGLISGMVKSILITPEGIRIQIERKFLGIDVIPDPFIAW